MDKRGIDLDRDTAIQKDRGDLYCRKDRKVLMGIRRYREEMDKREIDMDKKTGIQKDWGKYRLKKK